MAETRKVKNENKESKRRRDFDKETNGAVAMRATLEEAKGTFFHYQ